MLGDREGAVDLLSRALANGARYTVYLHTEPAFASLRGYGPVHAARHTALTGLPFPTCLLLPDRSSRWAAAGSPWNRTTRSSTTTSRAIPTFEAAHLLPRMCERRRLGVRREILPRVQPATLRADAFADVRHSPPPDIARIVPRQDVFYVGGGSTRNLLVLWREWGLDRLLAREWRRGKVFAGLSAGSLCWFESGVSDSFGPRLAPVHALGWIPRQPLPALRRRVRAPPGVPRARGRGSASGRLCSRRWRRAPLRRPKAPPRRELPAEREGLSRRALAEP